MSGISRLGHRLNRISTTLILPLSTTAILLSIAGFVAGFATYGSLAPHAAQANHQKGGGDCWQGGTPMLCRSSWFSGDHTSVHLKIINELSNASLWSAAQQGCANWHAAPGPQFCRDYAYSNDSWVYFKRKDSLSAPTGVEYQCRTDTGCTSSSVAANVQWSEIYQPIGNTNYPTILVPIAAHELGHALGLAHHSGGGALMVQGNTSVTGPTSTDIGPLPACSGTGGQSGVRCIFNASY